MAKNSWKQRFYEITKELIWRNIFGEKEIFIFHHLVSSQCWKTRNSLSPKKYSVKLTLYSNFFSKTVAFTKFLLKKCEREFLQFPHCVWQYNYVISTVWLLNLGIAIIYPFLVLFSQNFREITTFISLACFANLYRSVSSPWHLLTFLFLVLNLG